MNSANDKPVSASMNLHDHLRPSRWGWGGMKHKALLATVLLLLCPHVYGESIPEKLQITVRSKPSELAAVLKFNLDNQVLRLWTDARLTDDQYGGFFNLLDANGAPQSQSDKPLIAHLRLLWVHAVALQRTTDKERKQRLSRQYRDGMKYLQNNFRNTHDGSWYSGLTMESQPLSRAPQTLYQIYAIYILSELKTMLDDDEALRLAEETFELIDSTAWDSEHAGYFNKPGTHDAGATDGQKSAGINFHAMLALASLYRASSKPLYRQRLKTLYDIAITRLFDKQSGHSYLNLTRDWHPLPGVPRNEQRTLFGHTAELLWYTMVSGQTLGEKPDAVVTWASQLAGKFMVNSISADGVIFHMGLLDGEVTDRGVSFWAQAEAMNLFLHLYAATGECHYYEQFKVITQWTFKHLVISQNGLWWRLVDENGNRLKDIGSGLKWQAGLHETRMLLTAEQVLGNMPHECTNAE